METISKKKEGYFVSELILDLPYKLKSKSNFRRSNNTREWAEYKNFEKTTKLLLLSNKPSDWAMSGRDTPVALRNKVLVCIVARSVLDVGNYSKSLLDAAEGVLFYNDSEVSGLLSLGERGKSTQMATVGFKQVPPGLGLSEVNDCMEDFSRKVLKKFLVCF